MNKHTPAPTINGTELLMRLIERGEERNENGEFVVINHSRNGSSTKYIRYDAMVFELNKMIKENKAFAAAPELLEACVIALRYFNGIDTESQSEAAFHALNNAIKKATE